MHTITSVGRSKSHVTSTSGTYDLGCAMEMEAAVWYRQHRLEDAASEALSFRRFIFPRRLFVDLPPVTANSMFLCCCFFRFGCGLSVNFRRSGFLILCFFVDRVVSIPILYKAFGRDRCIDVSAHVDPKTTGITPTLATTTPHRFPPRPVTSHKSGT
jgi:hypothetical protein